LGRELLLGQDALVFELREVLELLDHVLLRRRLRIAGRRLLIGRLRLAVREPSSPGNYVPGDSA